jgi:predicted MFS family arabinose efflux permease
MKKFIQSNFKWYILALTMLSYGVIAGAARMCMPVLFKQISTDLNLNVVSLGIIWGVDPLAGIFVGLPGGLLVDRFGMKRTMTIICILAGIFCALRGLAVNFATMAAATFLFGMMAAVLPGIVPKTTAIWFKKEQLGFTNALIFITQSIFSMVATMTSATVLSPLLGGWRNVLFLLGLPAVIIGILWYFTGREPEKRDSEINETVQVPLRQALSRVIHIREIWIIGFITLLLWGATSGFLGYLPLYLRNIGWEPIKADSVMTTVNGAFLVGNIPMVLLASRFTGYKMMLFIGILVTIISLGLLPMVNDTTIWPLIVICNFLRSGASVATNVLIFETRGVGSTYGGTAMGLLNSIGMVGAFVAPPIGNSFANISNSTPFLFWSGFVALSLPLFIFLWRPKRNEDSLKLPLK